jgi:hypothetical protein
VGATDVGGPGAVSNPGPFPRRCYSTPRRRVSTSMRMKTAVTIAAFKFSVSAKSAAVLRKLRKVLIRLSGLGGVVQRSVTLPRGYEITGCKARTWRFDGPTPPLAGLETPSHPELGQHSGLAPRSEPPGSCKSV